MICKRRYRQARPAVQRSTSSMPWRWGGGFRYFTSTTRRSGFLDGRHISRSKRGYTSYGGGGAFSDTLRALQAGAVLSMEDIFQGAKGATQAVHESQGQPQAEEGGRSGCIRGRYVQFYDAWQASCASETFP